MMRPRWLAWAVCAGACRTPTAPTPDARGAMTELARCTLDGVEGTPDTARLEAAMRRALRGDRGRFAVRAGRCIDALSPSTGDRACLAGLRGRWDEMLPVIQRAAPDAIDDDLAVRRVGDAWTDALRRCP